jgi:hypothetical protein
VSYPAATPTTTAPGAPSVEQIRANYERRLDQVRQEAPTMNPRAAEIQLARAYSQASFALRQAQAAADRAELFADAVNDPQAWKHEDATAYRDARERAGRVGSAGQAVTLLNEAAQTGDQTAVLAFGREIVRHAAESPASDWATAAEQYLRQSGYAARHAERRNDRAAELAVSQAKYWLSVPEELSRCRGHPEQIDALGAQDERAVVGRATSRQRGAWAEAFRRSGRDAYGRVRA